MLHEIAVLKKPTEISQCLFSLVQEKFKNSLIIKYIDFCKELVELKKQAKQPATYRS